MKTPLTSAQHRIVAYVEVDSQGRHTISDRHHRLLGFFDPKTRISAWLLRPSHLPCFARLRWRAPFSFATSIASSNSETAPRIWRKVSPLAYRRGTRLGYRRQ